MKKNLLSIVILGLLIVNVVLTSVMLFSVSGTMKKTSALIDSIAVALKLELKEDIEEEQAMSVPMEDIKVYQIAEEMMIPLATGADGKDHFCQVSVSLSMNSKADGFKDYGETIADK
jgi:flagellar FliL protein